MSFLQHYVYFFAIVALLLLAAIYIVFKRSRPLKSQQTQTAPIQSNTSQKKSPYTVSNRDIEMVAGDDVFTTQLDLARAYMEIGKKNLAKSILSHVSKQGSPAQQQEALRLMNSF